MEHSESYSGSAGVRTTENYPGETEPANTFSNAAQDVSRDAQKRGREVFGKVAGEAQSVAERLRGEVTGALGEGKAQLATQIGGVARALKASSREFRNDDLTGLADLSEGLAEQVEAVEHYLEQQSSESLLSDVRRFAGRNRALFVGSLFVAGFVAVRFAQSTPPTSPAGTTSASRSAGTPTTAKTASAKTTSETTVVSRDRANRSQVKTYRTDR